MTILNMLFFKTFAPMRSIATCFPDVTEESKVIGFKGKKGASFSCFVSFDSYYLLKNNLTKYNSL